MYYLIGTNDYYQFFVGLFFLFLGIFVSLMLHVNKRDLHSPRTPINFSYAFMFKDNVRRLWFSILLSVILYRFSENIFNISDNMYLAFVIGFSFDKAAQYLRDKFNLLK